MSQRSSAPFPLSLSTMTLLLALEEYDVRFDEDTGLNIGLKQRGSQVKSGVGAGAGGRGGEQTVVFEVPGELRGRVKKDSVLLAVNNMPVRERDGTETERETESTYKIGMVWFSLSKRDFNFVPYCGFQPEQTRFQFCSVLRVSFTYVC